MPQIARKHQSAFDFLIHLVSWCEFLSETESSSIWPFVSGFFNFKNHVYITFLFFMIECYSILFIFLVLQLGLVGYFYLLANFQ